MSSDRREFIRHATALVAALGTNPRLPMPDEQPGSMPTARAKAMMTAFGLTRPIFQAGMGGLANPALAIAVSNAGAMGAIGLTNTAPDRVKALVTETKAGTSRPFAVNYLLAFDLTTLEVALDAGAPVVQFAWGIPSSESVATIRRAGARMGIQIASPEAAKRSVDLGADYLICQGIEAGGHVQAAAPLEETLPRVLAVAGRTPVIASGGIATGRAIRRALIGGASGVLMGTRFVATKESNAHPDYKGALIRAKAADTVFTICFQDGWTGAPHRVLRNRTFVNWEAAGCPPPGKRPGEGDVVVTSATGAAVQRYSYLWAHPGMTGDILELPLHAGRGVGDVRSIPGAGELVERLWKECLSPRSS
jgi:nitronate monooxygenase